MQSRRRPRRNPLAVLPAVAVLTVVAVACGSDEETFSGITQTGVTTATDPSTDTTAGPRPDPVEDTTTTIGAADPTAEDRPAYVNHVEVLILESFPPQVSVEIEGDHPTPCHETLTEVTEDGNDYTVMVWSVAPEAGTVCAQVLEPFEEVVPIGNGFEPGDYTVTVNGDTHPFSI
ncbi:hypothetical protein [Candidatus Spongiisocius sp.]|uniref:hypothetical protein n=1 Tax=Candidatus Spongiisocius sp. TaxID=3101273 RepID=UPI003B5A996D